VTIAITTTTTSEFCAKKFHFMILKMLVHLTPSATSTTTTSTATATTTATTSPSQMLCKSDYKWNSLGNVNFKGNKKRRERN